MSLLHQIFKEVPWMAKGLGQSVESQDKTMVGREESQF